MAENNNDKKKFKYLVTMRWYIETDEEMISGAGDTDEVLLNIVRHRKDGSKSCGSCPTRNHEGYAILDYHHFMGDRKPVYMSAEQIKD